MKITVLLVSLLLFSLTSTQATIPAMQGEDIFSDSALTKEVGQLRKLNAAERQKVRQALVLLEAAQDAASVTRDLEQVAGVSQHADAAVDAAVAVVPDGVLKGALVSSKKALGASYVLRLVNADAFDTSDPENAAYLEEIILRYQLASIPAYERPARALEFARAHLLIATKLCSTVGIMRQAKRPATR